MGPGAGTFGGVYRALVVNADDPLRRGRVEVEIPSVSGPPTMWATVARQAPSFEPAVGSVVVVAFEDGDADQPVVLGTLWDDAAPARDC